MRPYIFLRDDWEGNPKTVWSKKKQQKLFELLIQKYPTAKDLRKKLFDIHTEESIKLGKYINPNWNSDQYYRFIISNVIKYSDVGKVIIAQLAGAAIGTAAWIGLSKYMEKGMSDYDRTLVDLKPDEFKAIAKQNPSIIQDTINAERLALARGYSTNASKIVPFATGLGVKGLASYGTYSFLNKIDK